MNVQIFFSPRQKNPELWVKILIVVNVIYYLISLLVSYLLPGSTSIGFFSPTAQSLVNMGASGSKHLFQACMVHSLINANFLHVGIMHLLFNMVAFFQLFRPVCWSYGTDRALVIYIGSGVFAFLCSAIMGIQLTVGASGAIFGLMGALLYYAKSRGDLAGKRLFKEIAFWAVLILVIGFMFAGVNNVAHLTGLIAGGTFGWFLGFRTGENRKIVLVSNICFFITFVCLLYPIVIIVQL